MGGQEWWSHVTDTYSANTQKIRVLFFKLLFKIVKRSRGDPGETGAKQEEWNYSDLRAFGVLRRPRYFLQNYYQHPRQRTSGAI